MMGMSAAAVGKVEHPKYIFISLGCSVHRVQVISTKEIEVTGRDDKKGKSGLR